MRIIKESRMSKGSAVVLGLLAAVSLVVGQELIENPEKPEHSDPGRVIALSEVLRIPGEGEGYYHNGVNEMECDEQGNIYFHDFWSSNQRAHLLKFTAEGNFVGDFYRQGEGPGEVQSALDFVLSGDQLVVYDYTRDKIIEMALDGTFRREFKREASGLNDVIGIHRDRMVGMKRVWPTERKQTKLYDMKNVIILVGLDGSRETVLHTFINQMFLIGFGQGGGMMSWDPFISVLGDGKLFVCRTREYGIEVLDLNTGNITSRFTRRYRRVRHEIREWEEKFKKKYNAPEKKYESDIRGLLFDGERLWVKTSTTDPEKGALFDVFDAQGQFEDSFFIPTKGEVVLVQGDFLFASERDEEELPSVVKYRIDQSESPLGLFPYNW
jgi:hypothetical protein